MSDAGEPIELMDSENWPPVEEGGQLQSVHNLSELHELNKNDLEGLE